MKRIIVIFAALLVSYTLTARDFDVVSPSGHTLYCDIVQGGAAIVGWDYSSDGTETIRLVIPSHVSNGGVNLNVVAIGDNAFEYCRRLVSVTIPSSVKLIGSEAFIGCVGLGSIAVPSTVDSIGHGAFIGIPNVEYSGSASGAPWGANILNAYKEGQYYFADNSKTHLVCCERDASDATLPPTVTTIGDDAFFFCENITSIRIDSTITNVGSGAFGNCYNLESVFFDPSDQRQSDGNIFNGCKNLRQLTFGNTVTVIPIGFCKNCTSLQEIVIPDNITQASTDAFLGCTSLERAVIGNGITQIETSMFEECTSLKEVTMSENLQNIRMYSFRNCKSLREIILPVSVNFINTQAFAGCNNVSTIVCMKPTVPTMGDRVFDSIDSGIDVFVPCDKVSLYSQDSQWQRFDNIGGKRYYMVVTTNNPLWGRAIVNQQPTCDNDTAVIEAIPEDGCRFVKWDDNNTDNPRQIAYNGEGYAFRKAIFEKGVGIEEAETSPDIKIYSSHGNIIIEGAQGEQVNIFDITGRTLLSTKVYGSLFAIPQAQIPRAKIYIVKVGNRKVEKLVIL